MQYRFGGPKPTAFFSAQSDFRLISCELKGQLHLPLIPILILITRGIPLRPTLKSHIKSLETSRHLPRPWVALLAAQVWIISVPENLV